VGARRIYWLQDFLGRGTRLVLTARSPLLGATFGRGWERLATELLRRSDAIVAISDDFVEELRRRRIATPTRVIENWTPLAEVAVRPKDNAWATTHGLASSPVALYAGTLGLKHDAEHLVAAAGAVKEVGGVVVVVSEGLGRDHLERRVRECDLDNLLLFDFVDYDVLPDVLGAADVCLVLLDHDAGRFSVPSKLLSYLAAGRAVVAAVPAENLAARTIARSGAGAVVQPGDHGGFARAAAKLLGDVDARCRHGDAARAYAEATFAIERIADAFEELLTQR
jgi:glycosyltransferase involved in cell wall biosynthesis